MEVKCHHYNKKKCLQFFGGIFKIEFYFEILFK